VRLNLGCGKNVKPGWVNVDRDRQVDESVLSVDLTGLWPWDNNSCDMVYSEHLLEHLYRGKDRDDAMFFLLNAHRVLRPGGICRVGVPDAAALIRYYTHGDGPFRSVAGGMPRWVRTPMDVVQHVSRYNGHHKWMYDIRSLKHIMGRAGFRDVREVEWDAEFDSEVRRGHTIYAEGVR